MKVTEGPGPLAPDRSGEGGLRSGTLTPEEITAESFRIVESELQRYAVPADRYRLVRRVVHTTADFDFAVVLDASPGACEAGVAALRSGAAVITDVTMVQAGIRSDRLRLLGSASHCAIGDPDVRQESTLTGITRAALAMRKLSELLEGAVVVIGNAPTAAVELLRIMREDHLRPALVVAVPVGFVGTPEAKERIAKECPAPWIVTHGRKGGSPAAAAIVNELLEMAVSPDEKVT